MIKNSFCVNVWLQKHEMHGSEDISPHILVKMRSKRHVDSLDALIIEIISAWPVWAWSSLSNTKVLQTNLELLPPCQSQRGSAPLFL